MGDYCSGTNHVLPTYGYARAYSGLSLLDFQKRITVQELSAEGLRALGPTAVTLSGLEGLDAHGNAVTVRLDALARRRGMSDILALARPDILALKAYSHASWEPAFERLHANELPWRAETDRSLAGLNRYPEPQPHELAQRLADALRREARRSCCPAAAAMSPSTCWCAASAARASTTSSSVRRPSACMRWPRASRARRCARCRCCANAASRSTPTRVLAACDANTQASSSCAALTTRPAMRMDARGHRATAGRARGQGAGRGRRGLHRILRRRSRSRRRWRGFRTSWCCAPCRRRIGLAGARVRLADRRARDRGAARAR